jgi:hypothetical protein
MNWVKNSRLIGQEVAEESGLADRLERSGRTTGKVRGRPMGKNWQNSGERSSRQWERSGRTIGKGAADQLSIST